MTDHALLRKKISYVSVLKIKFKKKTFCILIVKVDSLFLVPY